VRYRTDCNGRRDQTAGIEVVMNIDIRWGQVVAACGGAAFASLLRRKRHNEKQAHKAELHERENEGGDLTPSPEATDTLVTTGSA